VRRTLSLSKVRRTLSLSKVRRTLSLSKGIPPRLNLGYA
jgi:hypothetical protein